MTAAAIAVPNTFAFSDAVVFGRVSDKVMAYWERFVDEAPVAPKEQGMVEVMVARVNEYFAKQAMARQLNGLSDHVLADMGLARADIAKVAA